MSEKYFFWVNKAALQKITYVKVSNDFIAGIALIFQCKTNWWMNCVQRQYNWDR